MSHPSTEPAPAPARASVLRRWLPAALVLLLYLGVLLSALFEPQPGGDEPALAPPVDLHLLIDESATLTLAQAQASPRWSPFEGHVNVGYRHAAVWVRLHIGPLAAPGNWVVEAGSPVLADVRMYQADAGTWREQAAGRQVPHAAWPRQSLAPSFTVHLPAGEHTLYLRLYAEHTKSAAIRLTPEAGAAHRELTTWLAFGLYFGLVGAAIALQAFVALTSRERPGMLYFPYLLLVLVAMLYSSGVLHVYVSLTGPVWTHLGGLIVASIFLLQVHVSLDFLSLRSTAPRLVPVIGRASWASAVVVVALVLAGRYAVGVALLNAVVVLSIAAFMGIALWLKLRRRHADAGFYLVAFGLFDLGYAVRYLRNLGWVEAGLVTDNAHHLGFALHAVLMTWYVAHRYGRLKQALAIERETRQEQQDFLGMVSHEFRTPLAIINAAASQLVAEPAARVGHRAARILDASARMARLLDEYLVVDRLQTRRALRLEPCDPYELLEEAASDWPVDRVRITAGPLPAFAGDRESLGIALRNLLANADRHSPPGTVIDVEAATTAGGSLRLSVVDGGEGIPADELPHIFQRYWRGRLAAGQPGAGLGLYLVRQIVEGHGGTVSVASTAGRGTRFDLVLPAAGAAR